MFCLFQNQIKINILAKVKFENNIKIIPKKFILFKIYSMSDKLFRAGGRPKLDLAPEAIELLGPPKSKVKEGPIYAF